MEESNLSQPPVTRELTEEADEILYDSNEFVKWYEAGKNADGIDFVRKLERDINPKQ